MLYVNNATLHIVNVWVTFLVNFMLKNSLYVDIFLLGYLNLYLMEILRQLDMQLKCAFISFQYCNKVVIYVTLLKHRMRVD